MFEIYFSRGRRLPNGGDEVERSVYLGGGGGREVESDLSDESDQSDQSGGNDRGRGWIWWVPRACTHPTPATPTPAATR
jgi:hypothetical protein